MLKKLKQQLIQKDLDSGYTLIEVMAAMTIMGVILAYSMPIFMFSHLKVLNSQRKAEALIVTQKILTDLSSRKISDLPTGGTTDINDPELLRVGGKDYQGKVTYCPNISGASGCRTNYRQMEIEIKRNEITIYKQQASIQEPQ
jgi:prepilin-type N-terminal cleavage/methylation domain-containing protein